MVIEKQIIYEIERCIHKNDSMLTGIGLTNGVLSASMFYYYHYLMTKDTHSLELVNYYIEKSLFFLNGEYRSFHFNDEIRELGLYINFLKQQKVLEDADSLLASIDEIIEEILIQKTEKGDLDLTSGFASFAKYFAVRNRNDKEQLIYKTLDKTYELRKTCNSGSFWTFNLRNNENPYVELGLGHGVTGVLNYLLFLHKNGFETNESLQLIHESLRFIWKCKHNDLDKINLFPFNAYENLAIDYHNLVYGEIGIGYTFYKAGVLLNQKDYCKKGLYILLNTTKFKDPTNQTILEAGLTYGSAGLSAVYQNLYHLTKHGNFLVAKNYWHQHLLQQKSDEYSNWAGFRAYYNNKYGSINMALNQGIIGIGIKLINDALNTNHNYISFYNYDL